MFLESAKVDIIVVCVVFRSVNKMSSFDSWEDFVDNRLTAADEDIFGTFQKPVVKEEEEMSPQRRLLDLCLRAEVKLHRIDGPQHHVCKEEEVEVPADQQLWNQEVKSSMKQEEPEFLHLKEEPEVLHLKEEPEELYDSQEGEQLVLKQEINAVMLTPTHEENDHSDNQTLCMKAGDVAAQTESVDNLPIISSVIGAANIDLLISSSCHISVSHDERRESSRKDAEFESQFQSRKTSNTSKKSYVCTICKRGYTRRNTLARHMKIHSGVKPYSCITCGKNFVENFHLTEHMRIHTGEKPHSCKTCGKHFSVKSSLIQHMKKHTGEKPYDCKTCGKHFRWRTSMITHMTIHTGEKPYGCETCGKHFRLNGHLTRHMRIHT
ncbi:zinc finger protein 461-like [Antennarius striatus]|uniref:zinc finger protein 461-like n=1 Tax=Antennarius striatus TaxID=241820 RepID=UPI0035B0BBA4